MKPAFPYLVCDFRDLDTVTGKRKKKQTSDNPSFCELEEKKIAAQGTNYKGTFIKRSANGRRREYFYLEEN